MSSSLSFVYDQLATIFQDLLDSYNKSHQTNPVISPEKLEEILRLLKMATYIGDNNRTPKSNLDGLFSPPDVKFLFPPSKQPEGPKVMGKHVQLERKPHLPSYDFGALPDTIPSSIVSNSEIPKYLF